MCKCKSNSTIKRLHHICDHLRDLIQDHSPVKRLKNVLPDQKVTVVQEVMTADHHMVLVDLRVVLVLKAIPVLKAILDHKVIPNPKATLDHRVIPNPKTILALMVILDPKVILGLKATSEVMGTNHHTFILKIKAKGHNMALQIEVKVLQIGVKVL